MNVQFGSDRLRELATKHNSIYDFLYSDSKLVIVKNASQASPHAIRALYQRATNARNSSLAGYYELLPEIQNAIPICCTIV